VLALAGLQPAGMTNPASSPPDFAGRHACSTSSWGIVVEQKISDIVVPSSPGKDRASVLRSGRFPPANFSSTLFNRRKTRQQPTRETLRIPYLALGRIQGHGLHEDSPEPLRIVAVPGRSPAALH